MSTTERRRTSRERSNGARKSPPTPKRDRHESPWQRTRRRSGAVWRGGRKLYRRHKRKRGASLFLIGAGGIAGSMLLFQGVVQLVTAGVCVGAMGVGYVIDRRDHAKTMQGTRTPSFAERRRYATNRGAGRPFDDDRVDVSRVRVRSHSRDGDGVTSHTRARPGRGGPGGARKPRTWDGSPESDADRRFFDLRESGYTGPIDQDGRRVDDHEGWMDRGRRPEWRDRYESERQR